jgi:RNA polymerase sigma-70 factor, ECF subfamily
MECVGTLSWNGLGLGWAANRPGGKKLSRTPASRRDGEVQLPASPLRLMRCDAEGLNQAAEATVPRPVPEGDRLAATARPARGEAVPLENDCSQIVRRCMNGDSGAWAELVRAEHRRVYGLCYRFTGNPADAEDLTQEVFLKLYSNLASFDLTRGSLQVWITTMTRNLLVDNFRRTRNQRATGSLDDGWDEAESLKPVDRLVSRAPSPHEAAASQELAKMVQDALARVSVDLREAVILRDLQDMDYKEIAQVLSIPEGTVKSRISRGRAELARLLERNKQEVM